MAEKNKKPYFYPEIRITGVSQKTLNDAKNIASNSGVTISALLKPEVTKIIASYPESMKMPPKKD